MGPFPPGPAATLGHAEACREQREEPRGTSERDRDMQSRRDEHSRASVLQHPCGDTGSK